MTSRPWLSLARLAPVAFCLVVLSTACSLPADSKRSDHPARWMRDRGFGVSTHYMGRDVSTLNQRINAFRVEKVAQQVASTGAGWFLLTLHHQRWLMSAPNRTFDELTGTDRFTAKRDLVLDLSKALEKRGVRLMLYVNLRLDPDSACADRIRNAMGGWPPDDELIENVAAVYREFSERYGKRVAGWWVDGAWLNAYRNAPERTRWFRTIRTALRSGHSDAVVAFNPGINHFGLYDRHNDYVAGEQNGLNHLPSEPVVNGAQWHGWTYLGGWWAADGTRFDTGRVVEYAKNAVSRGGAVTFEVGTEGFVRPSRKADRNRTRNGGSIDPEQVQQLRAVGDGLKPLIRSGD